MPPLLRLEGRVNAINDIVSSNNAKRKEKGDKDLMNFSESLTPKRYKSGGVNAAGNYTKPGMRKRIFSRIKAGTKGGNAGQWSARKAQMLAKAYKAAGGGYKN